MVDRVTIKSVECQVYETYLGSRSTHLLVPDKVGSSDFFEFAVSSYAEKYPDPKKGQYEALLWVMFYYGNCGAHLLNWRRFDLFSLSSPYSPPALKKLCQAARVDPTGSTLLDNIERMFQLGRPSGPITWDGWNDMLRRALYPDPDRIPIVDDTEDPDTWIDRELEKLDMEALRTMAERNGPLERVWPEISRRAISLLTFFAEKKTFEILHQGMERAYVMMENELDCSEKFLFRSLCLKNPLYLNRVMLFDPSPVTQSFLGMIARIYRELGAQKASAFLTPPVLGEMWICYYKFYPVWLRYKLDGEAQRRYSKRRCLEEAARRDLERAYLKRKGLLYESSPNGEIASPPDYLTENDQEAEEESIGLHEKEKKKRPRTFLTDRQREVVRLRSAGELNKEIAAAFDHSPSYVSKVYKRACDKLRNSWRRGGYRPLLENYYRATRRRCERLSSEDKARLRSLHTALIQEAIGRLYKGPEDKRRQLEKESIPPIFRDSPSA